MEIIFAALSALVVLIGAPFYAYGIFKGTTRPQRATWLIWSIQGVVAFTSQALLHGGWSLVYIGLEAIGNILVFMISLRYGVGGWKRSDKLAMAIALAGIVASLAVRQPIVALAGVILADLCGVILTLTKAYRDPSSEPRLPWIALGSAGLFSGLSVGRLSFQLLLYPLYLAASCFAVAGVVIVRRAVRTHSRSLSEAKMPDV